MAGNGPTPGGVDAYIAAFPPHVQEILERIRARIKAAAPEAQEAIKYQIPTYSLSGNFLSFAAYAKHIGLYPVPDGDESFREELAPYRSGKSTARFPLDRPMPYELIARLVAFRLQEHLERLAARKKNQQ